MKKLIKLSEKGEILVKGEIKMSYPINLKSRDDVIRLNDVACQENFKMQVSSGLDVVDARSLLALFTMIGKNNVNLVAPDGTNPICFTKALKRMGQMA